MDFIKTSSLRALIELTFQRNWNGLIWMSRKGVTTKRVKTPDGSIENQRPTAQSGWPRNEHSTLGQNLVRPSEVSAKVQKFGRSRNTTRETIARGRPSTTTHATPRTIRRASREVTPRGRATRPTYHARTRRPSRETTSRVRPRFYRPSLHPSDHSGRPRIRRHDRSDRTRSGHDPIPADRPDRPSQRRGRPEARFEARFHIFKARLNPKPPQKT
ncbi:unnamed protein product [Microthlaspi erraticum]|uniref:Uncharacterized protein n=1 Tax=Microthlaspi erraticum TaxID=1685480 RepID=A0A6D2HHA2_9BRAS|nr:unnamed protein product [Microthlaspi erraticum]